MSEWDSGVVHSGEKRLSFFILWRIQIRGDELWRNLTVKKRDSFLGIEGKAMEGEEGAVNVHGLNIQDA